jgi:hypothetical protein
MGVAAVYLYLVPGTTRGGLWCDACFLPSGVEADIWSLRPTGLLRIGTARKCTECGTPNVFPLD